MGFRKVRACGLLSICLPLLGSAFFDAPQQEQQEYLYLDQLALESGADKASSFHHYTKEYAQFFGAIKNAPLKFLEIGIWKGNSVRLWERYFPNAELHFIDITGNAIEYTSPRSHYHFLDQSDMGALNSFAKSVGGNFDIIIDDGGHKMHQQINSFKALFPYVSQGGLYIIEDLHTSYWKSYGGRGSTDRPASGQGTAVQFLKDLVEDLNYSAARSQCADILKTPDNIYNALNYYQKNIESIHFYQSVCVIKKR